MDRAAVLLQGLRRQLEHRLDSIRRSVGATTVSIVNQPDGEFSIRVEWVMQGGTKTLHHPITKSLVFGASHGGNPMALRIEKRACDYARDCIRQILAARGV